MWYPSPSEDQNESVRPNVIAAVVEPDRRPNVREDVKSSGPDRLAKTRSKADIPSIGPGSEYWLP